MRLVTLSLFMLALLCAQAAHADAVVTCQHMRDNFLFAKIAPGLQLDSRGNSVETYPAAASAMSSSRFAIVPGVDSATYISVKAEDDRPVEKFESLASHYTVEGINIVNNAVEGFLSPAACYL